MAFLRHNLIRVFLTILTLSVFAGELIADALPVNTGAAAVHGSHDDQNDKGSCPSDSPCPGCCAVHSGAVIVSNGLFRLEMIPQMIISFAALNEHAPSGDPVPIEYPPRLA